jgi:hypothetical protein
MDDPPPKLPAQINVACKIEPFVPIKNPGRRACLARLFFRHLSLVRIEIGVLLYLSRRTSIH